MRLCLVEDHAVAGLEPLALTRPAYDLRLGAMSLGTRTARALGIGPGPARRGAIVRSFLAPYLREKDPKTQFNDPEWLGRGPALVANARWVPPDRLELPADGPGWVGLCEGQVACAHVGPELAGDLNPHSVEGWFDDVAARLPNHDIGGWWVNRPWDIVARNNDFLVQDFEQAGIRGVSNRHLSTAAIVGPSDRLSIHDSARIDPYTVFDTTNGPITIEAGVWVQPFTRVEGPCLIGRDTHLFRANIRGGVTIGPTCRIGGEVEASIIHGWSNKYHEGFLGHAYIGEWVNLGAITSNSDLRNDYGEVQVPLQGDPVPTGMAKVGCFLGDHTRTGLGSMLNTGTVAGVMCNLLPAGPLLPKHVPSFAAVLYGRVAPGFPLDQMFATARIVKGRRNQAFTEAEEQLYLDLYEQTRLERERAFQKASDRHKGGAWPIRALGRAEPARGSMTQVFDTPMWAFSALSTNSGSGRPGFRGQPDAAEALGRARRSESVGHQLRHRLETDDRGKLRPATRLRRPLQAGGMALGLETPAPRRRVPSGDCPARWVMDAGLESLAACRSRPRTGNQGRAHPQAGPRTGEAPQGHAPR
ncbi:MAG: putative sugar nucleotidyl transferase [Isosphaeraceae bacterium]